MVCLCVTTEWTPGNTPIPLILYGHLRTTYDLKLISDYLKLISDYLKLISHNIGKINYEKTEITQIY